MSCCSGGWRGVGRRTVGGGEGMGGWGMGEVRGGFWYFRMFSISMPTYVCLAVSMAGWHKLTLSPTPQGIRNHHRNHHNSSMAHPISSHCHLRHTSRRLRPRPPMLRFSPFPPRKSRSKPSISHILITAALAEAYHSGQHIVLRPHCMIRWIPWSM